MASVIKVDTIQSTTSNVFFQNSAGTEYARFDSSGNFGIGTNASPSTQNGSVSLNVGLKGTNNLNLGFETNTLQYGGQLEFRRTGRTGSSRFAQIGVQEDSSANGLLIFMTAAAGADVSERMRIDGSGNVGIGTTSPSGKFHVESAGTNYIYTRNGSASGIAGVVFQNTTDTRSWRIDGTNFDAYDNSVGATRMRIDAAGEVLIGNTTASQTMDGLFVRGKRTATSSQWNFLVYTQGGSFTFGCRDDHYVRSVSIYDRTAGSAANVTIDSSGYLYRSTSSIKYKRDVVNYDKGISTVTQLRPVYYKSKVNDPDGNPIDTQYAGLIAEELDELGLDEFVVKDNDGVVESIHYGNMVALLTKAIQEQQSLITQLQADVAALKA